MHNLRQVQPGLNEKGLKV